MHKRQATQLNRFHTLSPRKLFRIFRIRGQDKIAYCEALSRDSLLSIYSLLMRPEFRPCLWRCLTSPFQGSCSKTVWRSLWSPSKSTSHLGNPWLRIVQTGAESTARVSLPLTKRQGKETADADTKRGLRTSEAVGTTQYVSSHDCPTFESIFRAPIWTQQSSPDTPYPGICFMRVLRLSIKSNGRKQQQQQQQQQHQYRQLVC